MPFKMLMNFKLKVHNEQKVTRTVNGLLMLPKKKAGKLRADGYDDHVYGEKRS